MKTFFANVYKSEIEFNDSSVKNDFGKWELPSSLQTDQDCLDAQLALDQLHRALK